jgi:beta-lactam-binding protein with PASTA domain
VSTGPQLVVLPNVVGLPRQQALDRMRDVPAADFDVRENGVFSEQPEGVVVAQDPRAGERIPSDATVRINVSKGTGRVAVPNVVGSTEDEATAELRQLGLTAKPVGVSSSELEGTVVAQSPAAGSEVGQGDSVRLNVSTGPGGATTPADTTPTTTGGGTTTVPDVVGLPREQAIAELGRADFRVQAVAQSTADEAQDGVVVRQQPAGGRRADTGSTVTLYVGEFSP